MRGVWISEGSLLVRTRSAGGFCVMGRSLLSAWHLSNMPQPISNLARMAIRNWYESVAHAEGFITDPKSTWYGKRLAVLVQRRGGHEF